MAFDAVAYALSKKYTNDTAQEMGALKGAPCTIDSIVHENGQNVVTFKWTDKSDVDHYSTMTVDDGTPIYVWTSGKAYEFGDLVIYAAAFYRCTTANSDITFDSTKWEEIGSADGNYDIVEKVADLPPRFTPADRKMYYVISEGCYYLWTGAKWEPQYETVDIDFKHF